MPTPPALTLALTAVSPPVQPGQPATLAPPGRSRVPHKVAGRAPPPARRPQGRLVDRRGRPRRHGTWRLPIAPRSPGRRVEGPPLWRAAGDPGLLALDDIHRRKGRQGVGGQSSVRETWQRVERANRHLTPGSSASRSCWSRPRPGTAGRGTWYGTEMRSTAATSPRGHAGSASRPCSRQCGRHGRTPSPSASCAPSGMSASTTSSSSTRRTFVPCSGSTWPTTRRARTAAWDSTPPLPGERHLTGPICARPILGGLHHAYERAA